MQSQIPALNHRRQLNQKIDNLKRVTAALLNEVKSINTTNVMEIEKGISLDEAVSNFEIHLIKRALEHTQGRQKRAARLLNVKYTTFCAKVKRYNIQAGQGKEIPDLSNEPRAECHKGNGRRQVTNTQPF